MREADYGDDQVLFMNTPAQADFLLHYLEQAARGIDKIEYLLKTRISHLHRWQASEISRLVYRAP